MRALLIDGVGRRCYLDVPDDCEEVLIPVPVRPVDCTRIAQEPAPSRTARFQLDHLAENGVPVFYWRETIP